MKMDPVETAHPFKVCAIALITFVVVLALARLFGLVTGFLSARIGRFIPKKVANVVGVLVATLLFWSIANNLLIRTAFKRSSSPSANSMPCSKPSDRSRRRLEEREVLHPC